MTTETIGAFTLYATSPGDPAIVIRWDRIHIPGVYADRDAAVAAVRFIRSERDVETINGMWYSIKPRHITTNDIKAL
jgi:hypothetical protein